MTTYYNGCDLNRHNGNVDFDKLLSRDINYVGLRLSVGNYYTDTRYYQYRDELIKRGVPWFCYHVVRGANDLSSQVERIKTSLAGVHPPTFFVWDCEDKDHAMWRRTQELSVWLAQSLRLPQLIYTANWVLDYVPADEDYEQLQRLALIVANYTTAGDPLMPPGWGVWRFWQYSADHNNLGWWYGCDSDDIDLLRYNGNELQFFIDYGGQQLPPPKPASFPHDLTMQELEIAYNEYIHRLS